MKYIPSSHNIKTLCSSSVEKARLERGEKAPQKFGLSSYEESESNGFWEGVTVLLLTPHFQWHTFNIISRVYDRICMSKNAPHIHTCHQHSQSHIALANKLERGLLMHKVHWHVIPCDEFAQTGFAASGSESVYKSIATSEKCKNDLISFL